jgi:hypothetical protein
MHTGGTPVFVETSMSSCHVPPYLLATLFSFEKKCLHTASTMALAASGSHLKGLSDTVVFMLLNKQKQSEDKTTKIQKKKVKR